LLVAGLFWEKSTAGWWLISQSKQGVPNASRTGPARSPTKRLHNPQRGCAATSRFTRLSDFLTSDSYAFAFPASGTTEFIACTKILVHDRQGSKEELPPITDTVGV
jgi:hypothetical protein